MHFLPMQVFINESQWNPLAVFYAKTGSVLSEIPASFNKGGFYIVGSGEVLSPAPAPPPPALPSPPPPPSLPPGTEAGSAPTASPTPAASPPAPPVSLLDGSGGNGLAPGAVAGIAVGAAALLLLLAGAAAAWRRRRSVKQRPLPESVAPFDSLKLGASEEGLVSLPTTAGGCCTGCCAACCAVLCVLCCVLSAVLRAVLGAPSHK